MIIIRSINNYIFFVTLKKNTNKMRVVAHIRYGVSRAIFRLSVFHYFCKQGANGMTILYTGITFNLSLTLITGKSYQICMIFVMFILYKI